MEHLSLLWRVDHALGKLSRQMLHRLGVTSPQRVALRMLVRAPDTTAAGIATLLSVDRSSVTGILQRLEDGGLISRTQDGTDGRKQRITVSASGRRIAELRQGTVEAAMERTLGSMDPEQVASVTLFFRTFAAELDRERSTFNDHDGDP